MYIIEALAPLQHLHCFIHCCGDPTAHGPRDPKAHTPLELVSKYMHMHHHYANALFRPKVWPLAHTCPLVPHADNCVLSADHMQPLVLTVRDRQSMHPWPVPSVQGPGQKDRDMLL